MTIYKGSLKNPQLLELSGEYHALPPSIFPDPLPGIGNPDLLGKLGIKTLVDLPGVGENLQVNPAFVLTPHLCTDIFRQDHPGINQNFQAIDSALTFDKLSSPEGVAEEYKLYVQNRTGLLSTFSNALVFIPWTDFMSKEEITQLKSELDAALAADPAKYDTPVYKLQRKWLDDDTVPELEMILFPRELSLLDGRSLYSRFIDQRFCPCQPDRNYRQVLYLQHSFDALLG